MTMLVGFELPVPITENVTVCGNIRPLPVYHIAAEAFEEALRRLLAQGKSRFMLQLSSGQAKVLLLSVLWY